MPDRARFRFNTAGTRFLIYTQPKDPAAFRTPQVVYVDATPGTIGPGPTDETIRVIDAKNKKAYADDGTGELNWRPPYPDTAPRRPPVPPDADGHFDHLEPETPEFLAAAAFAVARCVLEVWEHYFQQPLPWYFRTPERPCLELIPQARTRNAWSGEGYLEFGYPNYPKDRRNPFAANFDAVAHETGHLIMKGVIGTMPNDEKSMQFRAHEEAAADLIALIAALHFDSVVTYVLRRTRGKLFSVNKISRIGEWGPTKGEEVRRLFNDATMSSVRASPNLDKHQLSRPFSGGAFDVFVEIFESSLVARRLIPPDLAERSRHAPGKTIRGVQREFRRHFRMDPVGFRAAFVDARDDFARLLAHTWKSTTRDGLSYSKVVARMIAAAETLGKEHYGPIIRAAFAAREISPATSGWER